MKDLNNKIALLTGASSGIGAVIANLLAQEGVTVVGVARSKSGLNNTKSIIENLGGEFHGIPFDISQTSKLSELKVQITNAIGEVDILINNAGVASMNHSILTPISTARKILATNVIGTFLFSRESAKLMKNNKYGRIINFTTFAVPFKLEGEAIYAASKAGVITLTEILSREYASFGITVNAVSPPAIQTDLIRGVPNEKMKKLLQRQAIHRYGDPIDICNVIDFLIKHESGMVTGQIVYLGGV